MKRTPAHYGEMKLFQRSTEGNDSLKKHFIPKAIGAFLEGESLFYHLEFNFNGTVEKLSFSFDPSERKVSDRFTQPILSKLDDDHYSLMGMYRNENDIWLAIIKLEGDLHPGYPHFEDELTLAIVYALLSH